MFLLEKLTISGSYLIVQGLLKILKTSDLSDDDDDDDDDDDSPTSTVFPRLTYLVIELKGGHACSNGQSIIRHPIGSHCRCTILDYKLAKDLTNALIMDDEDGDSIASRPLEVLKVSECLVEDQEEIEFMYGEKILSLIDCCCTHTATDHDLD